MHSRRGQFEQDRRRQTMLTARGWRVLRVTWAQLVDEPRWFVRELRQALSLPA
ncbi:hypothetical protein GCM10011519_11790 [Marmoricola endophyticus]|uniref:DUF559 domain-containing protein n=1 Tax=Marmoricola endophyticus TaxID=2040280 RepID=A0A917BHS6_9ACTN|nr:hypothetical protein GCM10011519_11790 [Marmoricola endophyticus]